MVYKLYALFVLVKGAFFPLYKDKKHNDFEKAKLKIEYKSELPFMIPESSGLTSFGNHFLTINDGGNQPTVFKMDSLGALNDDILVEKVRNKDWESITHDTKGNIYVGDFGNNSNARRDLKVYKLDSNYNLIETIGFQFSDQAEFPPLEKKNLNFDCEAMFWYDGSLYLFSKNRGEKTVKLYQLNDAGGDQKTILIDSIRLSGMITGADVSVEGNEFVLLSYGFVYTFSFDSVIDFSQPKECRYFGKFAQSEAIAYTKRGLLVTNEQRKVFHIIRK